MSDTPEPNEARVEDCPFCDYAGPSKFRATSDLTYCIEPLNPVCEGHLLVIPWAHIEDFAEEPVYTADIASDAARIAQRVPGDYNLIASKGEAATQTIRHLHFHLIPRREGDGLALPWTAPPQEREPEARDDITAALMYEAARALSSHREGSARVDELEAAIDEPASTEREAARVDATCPSCGSQERHMCRHGGKASSAHVLGPKQLHPLPCCDDPFHEAARALSTHREGSARLEKALSEIRRCTEYDNAVGQLRKIRGIADAALDPTSEGTENA